MVPTDVDNPRYYHRVVDCQYACPAHTNVPEYIRLIAQGRHTEAYLLNRDSNVFPGILGRTCDRPCEPACRRTRVDGKPVAICRLKRVAADNRGDISAYLPKAPPVSNGRRIALVGAGPASLTVCNDLAPLGYECVIFEKLDRPGGLMRTNIPAFRLPAAVLDEEIEMITGIGNVEIRYSSPVESLRALVDEGWDAVFVGSGAPKGKELDLPGRWDVPDRVHIGIEWLESVHFGHVTEIQERVLIVGVGNTAMDCCRSAKRLGATDVKVMARRGRQHFKASPWELEDAEEEQVQILINHAPRSFVVKDGKLTGMEFERLEWYRDEKGRQQSRVIDVVTLPCDVVILAIGQENAFPWIERDLGLEFGKWDMPVVDETTMQSSLPGVFFGGDAAWGPKNIIWAVAHGHEAAI
ncbi:MAG: FAD-dependent oxidoreductase, partial [Gemmatimonadetes bacterium]|nr:FAD-dependent oxidoreductase [Gemmatimonadota bacterium]